MLIVFDFECNQETGQHIPNLVVARKYNLSQPEEVHEEIHFRSDNVTEEFCKWLFTPQHKHSVVTAHNLKSYDGYFLMDYLIMNSIKHDTIFSGSKIMNINIQSGLDMKVVDSLNFMPMALSKLPKTFGLKGVRKGDFPHHFNIKANYGYIGVYPDISYYEVGRRSTTEKKEMEEWHKQVNTDIFDFEKELLSYCQTDVRILSEACLKFRSLLLEKTGLDPFNYSTIASVTMAVFKENFLEEQYDVDGEIFDVCGGLDMPNKQFLNSKLALTPATGYVNRDNYSRDSILWLEWLMSEHGIKIQHALNGKGEHRIQNYRVDGFCEATKTIFEYQGCLWHGCPQCHPNRQMVLPRSNETCGLVYTKTQHKVNELKKMGYNVVEMWEHDFQQMKLDPRIIDFMAETDVVTRLEIRDAFFGGRTNATCLYYQTQPGEKIRYVDFTSLYPWVNKYARYPVGHPEIITDNFKPLHEYFGIAKLKILPPRGLYHPVLPYRSDKLHFTLCRTCADTTSQHYCTCNLEERVIIGTWCTPEIMAALEDGYTILKVYEVYHWEHTECYNRDTQEGGLFASFINTFLKLKQEASGWPLWCDSEDDKERYITEYAKNEGIHLDYTNIDKNPGQRSLAKLLLNSFWGKFGQRANLKQTQYIQDQATFLQLIMDTSKKVSDFCIVNHDTIMIEYDHKDDQVPDTFNGNTVIASFTTCWARLKLLDVLRKVDKKCLYYDTDSVIFVDDGTVDVPLGDYLGDLTNELDDGDHIVEFVSGGPKNYAYVTKAEIFDCKVKGFSLNDQNSKIINFNSMKQMVLNRCDEKLHLQPYTQITRDKRKRTVFNREQSKDYRVV